MQIFNVITEIFIGKYIYIYIYIYIYRQQYSTRVSNYNFYLVCGDTFRLLMQPSSGQFKLEQLHRKMVRA